MPENGRCDLAWRLKCQCGTFRIHRKILRLKISLISHIVMNCSRFVSELKRSTLVHNIRFMCLKRMECCHLA